MKFINKNLLSKRNLVIASGLTAAAVLVVAAVVLSGGSPARHIAAHPVKTAVKAAVTSVSPSPSGQTASPAPVNRLKIPALGVDAPIISIGLTNDGSLDAPKTLYQVGVYSGGPWPGQNGTAIVDGHSGSPTQHGVLEHINKLKLGDTISVVEVSGKTTQFRVASSQAYPAVAATAQVLFAKTADSTMNLISCYGNWNEQTQEFDQRWIIKAVLQ
jgi:LPXTG-site transpeptidase (sortase) family protein